MGWKIPTIPGSRISGDNRTGTPSLAAFGDAARRVALIRRHPLSQRKTTNVEPSPHTVQSAAGTHSDAEIDSLGSSVATRGAAVTNGSEVKGSFTCWMASEM